MSFRHYAFLLSVSFVLTFILTPVIRRLARTHNLVDQPGGRKIHSKPIPRIGGIALFIGMAVAICIELLGERYLHWGGLFFLDGRLRLEIIGVFIGITIVFIVGLIDDFVTLGPLVKLIGQIFAASIVAFFGTRIDYVGSPFGGLFSLGWMAYPVTIIYIVGFTNIVNLIDGLDGLAAGICAIAAASLLVLAAGGNHLDAAVLAAVIIGVCFAFLPYNFRPGGEATIFMGDSGALMLGFSLAVISLLGVMRTTATIALIIPLIIIGLPILDTASAIVRRRRRGSSISDPDKEHIHHQLLRKGFSQTQTVIIIWVWSIVLSVGGYLVATIPSFVRTISLMNFSLVVTSQMMKIFVFAILLLLSILFAQILGIWGVAYHHPKKENK